jgi:ring-1,2-phenylacetyl-CoA epoxidase subunit PaaC
MKDKDALFEYCLRIGDTALIAGQRTAEWCGHGPILEEDIALSNVALDMIGQARIMLSYAGEVEGKERKEDDLAYRRDEREFRNLLMAEQPNRDYGHTICRNYFLSVYFFHHYNELKKSRDKTLAAFAEKSLKEVAYHVRHSGDWILRLGDGTEESHDRMTSAVNSLWNFVYDMFDTDDVEASLQQTGIGADFSKVKAEWEITVKTQLERATLKVPEINPFLRTGSRKGLHTEHLGYILAEMQFLPRAYPDATW